MNYIKTCYGEWINPALVKHFGIEFENGSNKNCWLALYNVMYWVIAVFFLSLCLLWCHIVHGLFLLSFLLVYHIVLVLFLPVRNLLPISLNLLPNLLKPPPRREITSLLHIDRKVVPDLHEVPE